MVPAGRVLSSCSPRYCLDITSSEKLETDHLAIYAKGMDEACIKCICNT